MLVRNRLFECTTRTIIVGLLAIQLNAAQLATLPRGTAIRMKLDQNLSSAYDQEGDNVQFETLDDIKIEDVLVIPRGSTAFATITQATQKRYIGRGGKLSMNIDSVRMPDGSQLALRGVQHSVGGGHVGPMITGLVVTAIVFWPAAPFFFFARGKDASIPDGHELVVYTDSDYQLIPRVEQAQASIPEFLHNKDVLGMRAAGFSPELIIARIHSSLGLYELGTDDLWKLKQAGVPETVITAMIQAPDHRN